MTVEQPIWARSLFKVLALAMITLTAPQLAFAAEDDEDAEVVEEIVVTGSRIKRSDFTSSSPITVISGQSILESGFSNLGEALRNQAVAGTAGFNQSSILSGGGASSVDLRNLGQSRVLILVNGKRVASFADALANQAVDLSFVPTAMIDRVDILRDGASAIYGSDAISGVVNVILKERFEGVEVGASSGISGEGDGEQYNADFAIGTTSDRGSVLLGMEYRYQDNVNQTDRDWAFPTISSLTATGANNGSFFSPGGIFFDANGTDLYCTVPKAFGGDEITNDLANCPSLLGQGAVNNPDQVTLQRYDYALQQDLITTTELYSTAGYGVYELFDGIEGFLEVQYSKRTGVSRLDGNPGSFGTPGYPQGTTAIPATNPNLPAGSLGGEFYFRPTSTIGPRTSDYEVNTTRLVAGLRGEIINEDSFLNNWSWELSYLYTRLDATLQTAGTWNLGRFIRISDPDQCAIDTLCSQVVNPSGALDVIRPGNWTQDEIQYLRQNSSALSKFQTTGFFGVASGPVFEVPAGEVNVAVGFETRTDEGLSKPDSVTESGESVANQVFTTEGSFSVDEYFAELDVPLLANVPGFQSLDFNAQVRFSDYSNFGEETVQRFGLNWQIIDDVRIRATVSTAYRAPQITDLFGGGVTSFDFFTVPCSDAGIRASNPGVDANCTLDGIPTAVSQAAGQFAALSGGNAELEPETADTTSIGIVFTPSFLDGFSMSVDYWDIEVEDLISRNTSDSIVDACYFGPAGLAAPECDQFSLAVSGAGLSVRGLTNRLSNLDSVSTDGFDVGAAYEFDGPMDTVVNLDLQGTYVKENTFYPGAGGADDRGSIPRIKANFNANVQWNEWNFAWRMRYIHGMNDPRFDGNNVFGYDDVPSHTESDIRVRYDFDQYTAVFGVNDLFDRDPPYVFATGNNTDLFLYSPIGRYFFLRVSASL
ncbi:MAG: TonB-dependent receptor [Pseudomonadaceae bacterium]|nr:TonB-dependent receptor [Pseudomonadaceae bacterium]